ncbi:MAG: ABC transporter ATP-binding protein [Burkholderia contaminans]|uniref:ABC transporter ATP-binding protein n=1 Tax=Burkholderia contaminans TaxID=488447 RepID=A0AAP4R3E8_9BURK|nr:MULTISPECIES: ABC transporter ATP-binding protein [Burkholderia]MBD1413522.1 ABC transporter ATP-binding protein [Burkholderia contaminans]MBH9670027.1 ABC transporter ATP-binding protein [Burkholderia contaminans]MBH9676955.1 ABC transporter ATP-binding protein [Burkholderia contaminans]MBH9707379.1 ABC transporter ATP-binding protein [Burkholderia contaminans]MBH9720984.1 ABC transporter ATP-binding protein [Burkholderia contaminans]
MRRGEPPVKHMLDIERVSWSPGRAITVLDSVTLSVAEGEFVGLVGPNGSGKTSLLRCVFRYARPDAGRVALDAQDVWRMRPRAVAQRIAVLQQETPDDFGLTVDELVGMGRTPHQRPFDAETADDRRIVESALHDVGLVERRAQRFASLSGGEKQRALLARALAQQPELLLLDEPTNHLDLRHQLELLARVRRLGIATLATIHDLNLAAAYCDRLHVLAHGRVVASGTPADVLTEALLRDVFGVVALVDRHPVTGRPRITPLHPE